MVPVNTAGGESLSFPSGSKFPRILFVNELPPDDLAVCSVARQMLVGYPPERLSWWFCRGTRSRGLTDLRPRSLHRFPLPARLMPGRRFGELRGTILERIWAPLAA